MILFVLEELLKKCFKMRQSNLFTKTLREKPKDEKSINARILAREGFYS